MSDVLRPEGQPRDPQHVVLLLRALGGDLGTLQVWFDQGVLDRYRQQPDSRVIRSNSAGRVRASAGWSLDFGIEPDERLIHASAGDLSQRLPASERAHWAQHLAVLPSSRVFLTMRLGAGNCIDDGEIRPW